MLTCGGGGRVGQYVFLDPQMFLDLVRPLINTSEQLKEREAEAFKHVKEEERERPTLHKAFVDFGATCVASRALLEQLWHDVRSPTGEIGFFVELLEHCGLMCDLEKNEYFVPAASKATPSAGLALDRTNGAEQIAISTLPPSLMSRIVASLFKSGAINKPTKECVLTQRDVVLMLLRDRGVTSARRIRLTRATTRRRRVCGGCVRTRRCSCPSRASCSSRSATS